MPLFHSQTAPFQARVAALFAPGTVSFIYAEAPAIKPLALRYTQAFMAAGCGKNLALIDQHDTGLVPYLNVEANLLINGKATSLQRLPASLRDDTGFLAQSAAGLTPAQSLAVQFFRGLLGNRQVLLMTDFPASMGVQERRLFLNTATAAVQRTASRLVLLTADPVLIAAHPEASWASAPDLAAAPAPNQGKKTIS